MTELEIPTEPQHILMFKDFIEKRCDLPEITICLQAVLFDAIYHTMEQGHSTERQNNYFVIHSLLDTLTKMSILYMQNKE